MASCPIELEEGNSQLPPTTHIEHWTSMLKYARPNPSEGLEVFHPGSLLHRSQGGFDSLL